MKRDDPHLKKKDPLRAAGNLRSGGSLPKKQPLLGGDAPGGSGTDGTSVPRLLDAPPPSRGEIKRAGEGWERWGRTPEGREAQEREIAAARARGVEVPEDWRGWPGKRVIRLLLDRSGEAQVRTTPIHRDEAFVCTNCGADVPVGGRRPRDHCHRCLCSLHVDDVPGDRAAGCGGLMVPVGVEAEGGALRLRYRCVRCGAERRNRVLNDVDPPDDPARVRAVMSGGGGARTG